MKVWTSVVFIAGLLLLGNGLLLLLSSTVGDTAAWLVRYLPFTAATVILLALVFLEPLLAWLKQSEVALPGIATIVLLWSIPIPGERPAFEFLNGIRILPPVECMAVGVLVMVGALAMSMVGETDETIPLWVSLPLLALFLISGDPFPITHPHREGEGIGLDRRLENFPARARGKRSPRRESTIFHDVTWVERSSGQSDHSLTTRQRVAFQPLDSDFAVSEPIAGEGKQYLAIGIRSPKDRTHRELDSYVVLDLSASWKNPYQ